MQIHSGEDAWGKCYKHTCKNVNFSDKKKNIQFVFYEHSWADFKGLEKGAHMRAKLSCKCTEIASVGPVFLLEDVEKTFVWEFPPGFVSLEIMGQWIISGFLWIFSGPFQWHKLKEKRDPSKGVGPPNHDDVIFASMLAVQWFGAKAFKF